MPAPCAPFLSPFPSPFPSPVFHFHLCSDFLDISQGSFSCLQRWNSNCLLHKGTATLPSDVCSKSCHNPIEKGLPGFSESCTGSSHIGKIHFKRKQMLCLKTGTIPHRRTWPSSYRKQVTEFQMPPHKMPNPIPSSAFIFHLSCHSGSSTSSQGPS